MADALPQPHGHGHGDDDAVPPVTTPQGTQDLALPGAYEESDVSPGELVRWFFYLAAVTAGVLMVVWGAYTLLERSESASWSFPSEIVKAQPEPPLPRLLPNPVDHRKRAGRPPQGPAEHYREQRLQEDRELARLGLIDGAGRPALPEAATRGVITAPPMLRPRDAAVMDPAREVMPSDASGGTVMENSLR